MLEEPTTIIEEDLILEEVTSTLGDNQEVTLDNSKANDLFLGEATPPSSNRTPTPNNDRPRNRLNNNEQEGSSPSSTGKFQVSQNRHYEIPEDGILPGGRLQSFSQYWKSHINHPWPLAVIQEGYKIQWNSTPRSWRYHPMKPKSLEDRLAVDQANICQTSSQSRRKPKDDLS
ncbi:hypothetical protein G6F66_013621 [Rhizopus arrhizus]|nr:hypothetical protein G6F66_013621 [Rhizopus arrhizus]